eukprot:Selendium_serpulae@DN4096_c0_g1_i3.p2
MKGFKNTPLTDAFTAERVGERVPFSVIHFAISADAHIGPQTRRGAGSGGGRGALRTRKMTLMYHSPAKGAYLTVHGLASVVEDGEARRHYWLDRWGASLPDSDSPEYLLMRLRVEELELHVIGLGEFHWSPIAMQKRPASHASGQSEWNLV